MSTSSIYGPKKDVPALLALLSFPFPFLFPHFHQDFFQCLYLWQVKFVGSSPACRNSFSFTSFFNKFKWRFFFCVRRRRWRPRRYVQTFIISCSNNKIEKLFELFATDTADDFILVFCLLFFTIIFIKDLLQVRKTWQIWVKISAILLKLFCRVFLSYFHGQNKCKIRVVSVHLRVRTKKLINIKVRRKTINCGSETYFFGNSYRLKQIWKNNLSMFPILGTNLWLPIFTLRWFHCRQRMHHVRLLWHHF